MKKVVKHLIICCIAAMLSGCVAGKQKWQENPGSPPERILVEDYRWYEYNELWFNNGGPCPWWAYLLIPIVSVF